MQMPHMGIGWDGNKNFHLNKANNNNNNKSTGYIVIPYAEGLCESIKNICGRYGIQTYFKENRTLKNNLVKP